MNIQNRAPGTFFSGRTNFHACLLAWLTGVSHEHSKGNLKIKPNSVSTGILLFLLLLPSLLHAITFPMKHFTVSDGLPQTQVHALIQDERGILYVGTVGGLAAFDGHRFDTFGLRTGLPSLEITSLAYGSNDRLWVGTDEGLTLYHAHAFQPTPVKQNILRVRAVNDDAIFSTADGLYALSGERVTRIKAGNDLLFDVDEAGEIALLKGKTLFTGRKSHLTPHKLLLGAKPLDIIKRKGRLYILTEESVLTWSHKGLETLMIVTNPTAFTVDAKGTVWTATIHTFRLYSPGKSAIVAMPPTMGFIKTLYTDPLGNVWIGRDNGLTLIPFTSMKIFREEDGIPNVYIRSLLATPKGKVLIGGANYLVSMDPKTTQVTPILFAFPKTTMIRSLALANDGCLLIGTHTRGLFARKRGILREVKSPDDHPMGIIYHMKTTPEGTWIATQYGLFLYNKGRVKAIESPLLHPPIYGLAIGENNTVLCGMKQGIVEVKEGRISLSHMLEPMQKMEVNCLFFDSVKHLWVGTHGSGLAHWNGKEWERFDESNHFPNNFVWDIVEDRDRHIWVCTNRGIHLRLDSSWISFTSKDGLPGDELFIHCAVMDIFGNLHFGLSQGLLTIEGGSSFLNLISRPTLQIYQIQTPSRNTLYPKQNLLLTPRERTLTVSFSGVCYKNASSLLYRYKLDPVMDTWSPPSTLNQAQFSTLKPGHYTFRVKAESWGHVAAQPVHLDFSIQPRFFETIWFKLLAILTLLMIAFLLLRMRILVLKRQQARLEEMVEEQTHKLKEKVEEIENLSVTDMLTEIHNRRFFNENFKKMIALGKRMGQTICFAIIDLDNFKDINDFFGHLFGDEVLKGFARILTDYFRQSDLVARYGGDEFIVGLLTNDVNGVLSRFETFIQKVSVAPLGDEDQTVNLSASVGVALLPLGPDTEISTDILASVADAALYASKNQGKNRVTIEVLGNDLHT